MLEHESAEERPYRSADDKAVDPDRNRDAPLIGIVKHVADQRHR